jgi:hypothetical protein
MRVIFFLLIGCSEYSLESADKLALGSGEDGNESHAPIAVTGPSLRVIKGNTIDLYGLESYDPDNTSSSLTYQWTITETVDGANVVFGNPESGEPTFSSDLVGSYIATLVVTDSDQLTSQNYAATLIEVRPYENLTVEANWDVIGADVDLHVIAPNGSYYGEGDCFFGNPSPDWGLSGDPADDPQLLIDDEGAESREQVELLYPEEGMYSIYVTYYNQREGTSSQITPDIKITGYGQTLYEGVGPVMESEGQVWRAGFLFWDQLHFEPDIEVTDHFDLGGPSYNQ